MHSFTQNLSDKDLRKTLRIHYYGYKYTLITPVLGALVTLFFLVRLALDPQSFEPVVLLVLVAGVFFMLRPRLYISRIFANIKSQKLTGQPLNVQLDDDEKIVSTAGDSQSVISLKELHRYAETSDFLFLYVTKNNFLALDKREMPSAMLQKVKSIIEKYRIRKR